MLRLEHPVSSRSLLSLSAYRAAEEHAQHHSTTIEGDLLEYHHLELRVHPPNVEFRSTPEGTILTIDSANRPGTLVEVVQCLTEMGLNVSRARISSDGGWFVDEFVCDRITDAAKQNELRRVLTVEPQYVPLTEHSVFELAGPAQAGLLADVVALLKHNGCDVEQLAVWTSAGTLACVVSVTQQTHSLAATGNPHAHATGSLGQSQGGLGSVAGSVLAPQSVPTTSDLLSRTSAVLSMLPGGAIRDTVKLQRLQQLLARMLDPLNQDDVIVQCSNVKGAVHFERRLHQLLMRKEEAGWEQSSVVEYYENLVGDGQQGLPSWGAPAPSPRAASLSPYPSGGWQAMLDSVGSWADQTTAGHASNGIAHDAPVGHVAGRQNSAHRLSVVSNGSHAGGVPEAPRLSLPGTAGSTLLSPKYSTPEVRIRYDARLKYWLLDIRCKDRKKLFFDTVCTLSESQYDIFHASVDVDQDTHVAHQVYYVRRSTGDNTWCQHSAAKLCYMLERAISRRFPKGVKICIQSWQQYDLAALTAAWRDAGLFITRAKVRPCPAGSTVANNRSPVTNTFYVLDHATGQAPDPAVIQQACEKQGGVSLDGPGLSGLSAPGSGITTTTGRGVLPPKHGHMDSLPERCKGAAFGFALKYRQAGSSPSSMSSSM